jgi:putative flippase GtrA
MKRIVRYLFSGVSAVVADLVVLFVLEHYLHLWYLLSAIIAFVVAVYVSFNLQKFFTFNDYTKEGARKQMFFYLSLQVINLCLNTLFMYIGVDFLHIQYIVSQIIISGVMAVSNFFIYKYLVFRPDTASAENNI